MPSHAPGKAMPGFLGGSDLVDPGRQRQPDPGDPVDRRLHRHQQREGSGRHRQHPERDQPADGHVNDKAAARSWFVPQAVNWVDVENANVLPTMLRSILSGQLSVKQAATVASEQIAATLNQPAS